MDRQSGKMSQKYECLHCGAVFSKRSLLEEHKRILGHRDLFSCGVCHKNFYRKDNLETHRKKHDKINNICYQHFSEPESLELHHVHTHGQTGRGQKRKGQENYGPPVKRKLTTFDNPEDMYTIMVMGEHRMPTFNTTPTRYKVTFKDLDNRGVPNILKSLKVLFNSIIKNITEFMDPSDLV
ncbi:KRAB [Mytilus coruscus]|uniref:KRAB n=1 Tax=Mytilus coruscus TaxID=42192 RepID=A0A6J8C5T8_MYTCO|nr:KRAB [Mytilus coruscus]